MSVEEVKQALEQQKYKGLENDAVDVLADAFELPREVLVRVFYAYQHLQGALAGNLKEHDPVAEAWSALLPDKLREAIKVAMHHGARRMMLRHAIEAQRHVYIATHYLVPDDQKNLLCKGCPRSIPCFAEGLSTPEKCYKETATLGVMPIRLVDKKHFEVESARPPGKFKLPLQAIPTNQPCYTGEDYL